MADPYHHAVSSAKKWGGTPEQYLAVHKWFDHSKTITSDPRHRSLRHHTEGIETACDVFGQVLPITLESGKVRMVSVRWIGEQHMREDFGGRIPTALDWIMAIKYDSWMNKPLKLSAILEREEAAAEASAQQEVI